MSQSTLLRILTGVMLSFVVACAGGGGGAPAPQPELVGQNAIDPLDEKSDGPEDLAADEAVIKEATAKRDAAIVEQKLVDARNAQRTQEHQNNLAEYKELAKKYELELKDFNAAKREYDSLRALEFGKKLSLSSRKWYEEIVRDFPGTAAAKEATRRLSGMAPRAIDVPPAPVAPRPPVRPPGPKLEEDVPIPIVPTLEELQENRRLVRASENTTQGAGESIQSRGSSGKSIQSRGSSGKTVDVRGYVTKKGTYVAPHTRGAPGTGRHK